jgi:DNA transposition AAA+ family ATPase
LLLLLFDILDELSLLSLACGYDCDSREPGIEDVKKVKEILSRNPAFLNQSLDRYDNSLLIIASRYNSRSVVEFLLERDAIEVNKQNRVCDFRTLYIQYDFFSFFSWVGQL